jgi:hypothetical protein
VSPRATSRTEGCSEADASSRLRDARKFLEMAELGAGKGEESEYARQSVANAILAGIAAADAACCKALGRRSRGQDHRAAVDLVGSVEPGGKPAANALNRLLGLKDEAHYGMQGVGQASLKAALRQAKDLIRFAERTLER